MKTKHTQCEYANDGERITQPGKFEGCPVFAPHYWNMALDGFADRDDGTSFVFKFTTEELAKPDCDFAPELKAWLGRKRTLTMREDGNGFVHCL